MKAVSTPVLVTALVIALVAVGAAAYLLMNKGQSSASKVESVPENSQDVKACLQGPSAIIVYEDGQEDYAKALLQFIKNQLRSELPRNAKFCVLSDKETGLTSLPVYPALVFKLNLSDIKGKLAQFIIDKPLPGGFYPFRYDYFASFATQAGMYLAQQGLSPEKATPKYTHSAEVIIVNGDAPGTQVNEKYLGVAKGRLSIALSAIAVAEVKNIKVSDKPPVNSEPQTYPAIYILSDANLTQYNPDLVQVSKGVFTDKNGELTELIAGLGLASAALVKYRPVPYLDTHPAIGSGKIHIVIFDDILCPYCARLYKEVMPKLVEFARNNTVTIHIMDFIVHNVPEAVTFHKLLLCYYNKTGDAWKYYEIFQQTYSELYSYILSGKAEQKLKEKIDTLRKELNVTELCPAAQYVDKSMEHAPDVGIRGVPGILVWKEGGDKMLIAMGFHDYEWFTEVIKWFETH
ncbi:hypothetical protein PYJP_20370 [Pyrofollis japonicus]|uniref:DsbA family protein n=1 Tax=Pyrofollis japonicus TaxID=3060460 RepID=UPI00295AD1AF|nr:thioredoxin domain-containing protein [Pyrofollis japonicus]BEP18685.1 hypothetical protein PYJP_20370 [Pyrofollis japonicus]